ncbi:GNAT family N-acetyltransferase [Lysobacter sp. A3-1-A15]|uniref:GNAT family N-acetyltransferase n=1 Tax=Novilysobacter viscosus TaxID=3098602 RepID=UPI002ED79B06
MSQAGDAPLVMRTAREADLQCLVAMLADDPLGATREHYGSPLPAGYRNAFDAIAVDPNNELIVAEQAGEVIGMLQLTYLPSLTYQGRWRAMVEGVRVARAARSGGVGRRLVEHALHRARERGCHMVQLTTDKARPEALAFYRALGFTASHEGLKRSLA